MGPENPQDEQSNEMRVGSPTSSPTSQEQQSRSSKKSLIREYSEAIIIAIILAFTIRVFVVQAFKIPSGSMIPTFLIGDHILVSKLAYGLQWPADCTFKLTFPPVSCYTSKTLIDFGKAPKRGYYRLSISKR